MDRHAADRPRASPTSAAPSPAGSASPARRTVQGELERALAAPLRPPGQRRRRRAHRRRGPRRRPGRPLRRRRSRSRPPASSGALNALAPGGRAGAARVAASRRRSTRAVGATGKRYRYRLAWGADAAAVGERCAAGWCRTASTRTPMRRGLAAHPRASTTSPRSPCPATPGTGAAARVRTVHRRRACAGAGRRLDIVVEGDGFLRGMVRRIVGGARRGRARRPAARAGSPPCSASRRRVRRRRPRRRTA